MFVCACWLGAHSSPCCDHVSKRFYGRLFYKTTSPKDVILILALRFAVDTMNFNNYGKKTNRYDVNLNS